MRICVLVVLALAAVQPAAGVEVEVASGTYQVRAPDGWDERLPLPVLVAFHGYSATGSAMTTNAALADLAAEHGYLLVAPDGRANSRGVTSWSHQGSPAQNRDEFAFIDAVLADVRGRFPVASGLPVFVGFSQGASMVWDLACQRGGAFGRYVAVGGGFWQPMPEACRSPVGDLIHVHGLDDAIVPLEGRPIGTRWHQADIFAGLERFKAAARCPAAPERLNRDGALHCRTWSHCAAGRLTLCLHPGGHTFPLGPLARVLEGE